MADSYHHALSSARRFGGEADAYLAIHRWFDASKAITADYRHRALRHHAEGIALCVEIFGPAITKTLRRQIPTRWIAEQQVRDDFGCIPSFVDWVHAIKPEPWMGCVPKMPVLDERTPALEPSKTEDQ